MISFFKVLKINEVEMSLVIRAGIYILESPAYSRVKVGFSTGSTANLYRRYKTVFGHDFKIHYFPVTAPLARIKEKQIHQVLKDRGCHVSNELFKKESLDEILELTRKMIGSEV